MTEFIERLDEEKLKKLAILGLAEMTRKDAYGYNYLCYEGKPLNLDSLIIECRKFKDSESLTVTAFYQKKYAIAGFIIDDFSMRVHHGILKEDLSEVLKNYLANQFGVEYTDYLLRKRVEDAIEEKFALDKRANEYVSELYPRYLSSGEKLTLKPGQ